ncbi:hypothetical protein J2W32_004473 [Variovorax boronicumulans]|uniref:Phage tail protein n=1 Tax=Variovorax boronicumulans TaxID=436515 RepID=A0AAW8CYE8_9BURK|nr:hypothetical protein [Variovorax boronicumulans]MDP9895375.1 hypothetical protein [Variovorax boronicumulans]MDQ0055415.1 hypothetical protein [Variovorax boronicumulans]
MATITSKAGVQQRIFGGTPYGNRTVHKFSIDTNAAGGLVGGDVTTAIGLGDKVRLGRLPVGFELHDALTLVSTAFTALVTAKLGFEYVDGVDDTQAAADAQSRPYVPQDDDYFGAAIALNAAGRYRASNTAVRPVTLPKDAYLILTTAGAANAKVAALDILVEGVDRGPV